MTCVFVLKIITIVTCVVAASSSYPVHGDCMTQIFPPSGAVVSQTCAFEPGGVHVIPMLVHGQRNATLPAYFESWGELPAVLGTSPGSQWGQIVMRKGASPSFNSSVNCDMDIVNNAVLLPNNSTWLPMPPQPSFLNWSPAGLFLAGQGTACIVTRIYGLECELIFDALQKRLAAGVPRKLMPIDRQTACNPVN